MVFVHGRSDSSSDLFAKMFAAIYWLEAELVSGPEKHKHKLENKIKKTPHQICCIAILQILVFLMASLELCDYIRARKI